jgi:hypothetical protein
MKPTKKEIKFMEALLLAITAPNDKLKDECVQIASSIGSSLTEKQRDLAMKGVECRIDYARLRQEEINHPEKTVYGRAFIPGWDD